MLKGKFLKMVQTSAYCLMTAYASEWGRGRGTPGKAVCGQRGASGEPSWNGVWMEAPPGQDRAVSFAVLRGDQARRM